jgi:hypothetical protein
MRRQQGPIIRTPTTLGLLVLLGLAGYYLVTEHTLSVLPYSLMLLCVGVHLFMHCKGGQHRH